jgi:hypothetical protein
MPPTLSILKNGKMTSMSGEFYDTENASATQAYLRKLHLKQ